MNVPMKKKITIAAQLSSVHSRDEELEPGRVARRVDAVTRVVPIDILAVGWKERPDLFRSLTARGSRPCAQVFLWYPLLSDYPGFGASHLVVTSDAAKSRGWAGYEGTGVEETFKLACPNNPQTLSTSLAALEECMSSYDFDGVFLDKIRFPSPASGLQELFSCFCPFCAQKAAAAGLDLEEVRAVLKGRDAKRGVTGTRIPPGAEWLENLLADQPLLRKFVRFRADSMLRAVSAAVDRMTRIGRKISLDVFSPALAPLVGQDLPALARHADWIKPMIYRLGTGPSSLRTEIPALVRDLGGMFGLGPSAAMQWAAERAEGLEGQTIEQVEEAAPLGLIRSETRRALTLASGTPLFLGLETVSIPGRMEVHPRQVQEIVQIGLEEGVQGFVLSWDLLHTPLENLGPLKSG